MCVRLVYAPGGVCKIDAGSGDFGGRGWEFRKARTNGDIRWVFTTDAEKSKRWKLLLECAYVSYFQRIGLYSSAEEAAEATTKSVGSLEKEACPAWCTSSLPSHGLVASSTNTLAYSSLTRRSKHPRAFDLSKEDLGIRITTEEGSRSARAAVLRFATEELFVAAFCKNYAALIPELFRKGVKLSNCALDEVLSSKWTGADPPERKELAFAVVSHASCCIGVSGTKDSCDKGFVQTLSNALRLRPDLVGLFYAEVPEVHNVVALDAFEKLLTTLIEIDAGKVMELFEANRGDVRSGVHSGVARRVRKAVEIHLAKVSSKCSKVAS